MMRSPQESLRNGVLETSTPPHHHHHQPHHFHSTVSLLKLRRFNTLILIFRFVSFCFCLASTIFMATNSSSNSLSWADFTTLRVVVAANGIVAVYSLAEMGASIWEILKGTTVFPETIQVWFDFSHDQVFAYLLVSANVAGTTMVRTLRNDGDTCSVNSSFCVQSTISISLGYVGFLFLGFSSLLSGFRVGCFIINGSRFHL
ncbi:hypothetical protein C5167_030410 [Papaver somniferum]|uniref:CASP-like protein 4C2 n=1 Tax=Papaver somniferum TaxID=3469 RepID=UPI000E7005EF|nr:CASP-like protein 4C2 [Papaver somniferum]RZC93290.1 hypothetical protein C5167_030410 [Papaver somniferum]